MGLINEVIATPLGVPTPRAPEKPDRAWANRLTQHLDAIDSDYRRSIIALREAVAPHFLAVTASYAITDDDRTLLADATAGNITLTLPTASLSEGVAFTVKRTDASGNTVTLDPDGTDTIDGAVAPGAITLAQYEFRTVLCDGTSWHVVAKGTGP